MVIVSPLYLFINDKPSPVKKTVQKNRELRLRSFKTAVLNIDNGVVSMSISWWVEFLIKLIPIKTLYHRSHICMCFKPLFLTWCETPSKGRVKRFNEDPFASIWRFLSNLNRQKCSGLHHCMVNYTLSLALICCFIRSRSRSRTLFKYWPV